MSNTPHKSDDLHAWTMAAGTVFAITVVFIALAVTVGPFKGPAADFVQSIATPTPKQPLSARVHSPLIPHKSGFPTSLSAATIQSTHEFFQEPSVEGVIISGADFHKNTFTNVYETYRDVPDVAFKKQDTYDMIGDEPAFNDRIFKLMGGKLDCQSVDAMAGFKSYLSNPNVSWTCAVSIPPVKYQMGNSFGGFLSVLLSQKPDAHTQKFITTQAEQTSATLFPGDSE